MRLRLGTRGSELAVTQSGTVADALRALGHEVEMVTVTTRGDTERRSLVEVAGIGVFAAELRTALLAGECDLAVHSFKDLPVAPVPGLVVAAVPPRADVRDALCSRGADLADLPAGSRVGTGSPRRVAQLRRLRPDLEYVDIRGNVGTRLARVRPGDLDAVVLAAAGLERLGLAGRITEYLDILPAPSQGALAVECRSDDPETRRALAELDDVTARAGAEAERALLAALGGGCAAPIAARGEVRGERIHLSGGVFAVDGEAAVTRSVEAPLGDAAEAGAALAGLLLANGAAEVTELGESRPSRLAEFHDDTQLWAKGPGSLGGVTVLVPRAEGTLVDGLREAGATVVGEELLERVDLPLGHDALPAADWVAITSVRTLDSLAARSWRIPDGAKIAAVGPATAAALRRAGYLVSLEPGRRSSAEDLLAAWPDGSGTVLVPGSVRSSSVLVDGLNARGWHATAMGIYDVAPRRPSESLRQAWERGSIDAVLVTSGSVAHAVGDVLGWRDDVRVVAFGRPSAAVLSQLGIDAAVAETQDAAGVVAALERIGSEET